MAGGDDVEPIIIIIIIIQNEHRPSSFVPLARRPRATTTPRGRPILLSRRSWSFEILVSKISTSAVAFGHVGVPQALFLLCLLDNTRAQRRKKRRKQAVHFCASIGKTVTSRRKKSEEEEDSLLLRWSRQTTLPLSRFVAAFFDALETLRVFWA